VKARAKKVWKMKIKVDNLIQKENNKETKKMCNIGKKGFCAFCFLFFGRFEKWQEPVFKCMCSWDAVSLSRKTPLF